MIILVDFLPSFCCHCGGSLKISRTYGTDDFLNHHCASQCACGAYYAHAETASLLAVTKSEGGDLARYHDR